MATHSFQCSLVTPEAHVFDNSASAVILPLHDGSAGVLPNRAPFVAELGLGELRITFSEGGTHSYFVEDGFAQMVGNKLSILAQTAIPVEQISIQETEAALAEAAARRSNTTAEMEQVARDRARARARMDIAQRFRRQGGGI